MFHLTLSYSIERVYCSFSATLTSCYHTLQYFAVSSKRFFFTFFSDPFHWPLPSEPYPCPSDPRFSNAGLLHLQWYFKIFFLFLRMQIRTSSITRTWKEELLFIWQSLNRTNLRSRHYCWMTSVTCQYKTTWNVHLCTGLQF